MSKSIVAERIAERLSEVGWTQQKLAGKIKVSQPIVSAYLRGDKKPGRQTLEAIARELDVTVDYLLGKPSDGARTALTTPGSEFDWGERHAPDDGTRSYGNARAELFRVDYEVLAGEPGQNSNDAGIRPEVAMEYALGSLSGVYLERFLAAAHWPTLRPHYDAVAADVQHRTSRRYARALEELDRTEKLWVLRIDDYGTSGLIGDELKPSCYSGLVRFSQHSEKKSDSSGGRFGLGSASLSAASGFDLVFFLSDLSEPIDTHHEGRLIGRAVFPYHELPDGAYEGPFFFGVQDPQKTSRRVSGWASNDLRRDLWMQRDSNLGNTGTSILIVGFTDPDGNEMDARTAEHVIKSLAEAFEDKFWPAIARGRLSARFTRYENDRLVSERVLDAEKITHPFVSLFSDEESIIERPVSLHVPASSDGEPASDHSARLLVQLLPEDRTSPRTNEVALMRGALMVVKYKSYPSLVLGARPFRAALLGGEAAVAPGQAGSAADHAAELFLSKAEPPNHNDWTSRQTDLTTDYRGGKKQLDAFFEAVRTELKDIVAPERQDDSQGPEALRKLLSILGEARPPAKKAEIRLDWRGNDYQTLEATVRLNFRKDRDRIALRPQLNVTTDSGAGIDLPFTLEAESGASLVGENQFMFDSSARDATILLHPNWDVLPVRPDLSAVRVDVAISERSEV